MNIYTQDEKIFHGMVHNTTVVSLSHAITPLAVEYEKAYREAFEKMWKLATESRAKYCKPISSPVPL